VLHINSAEWAVVIFVIGLVLVAEMINTSVEAVVDLLTSKYHLKAKVAKDVSAGMVLVSAFIAVVTGILVYLPHIKKLIYP
jgi:diacylglycerol kinase